MVDDDSAVVVAARAGSRDAIGRLFDRRFPEHSLPLRLEDAEPGGIEGQPENVIARRMLARAGADNIDVLVFFGSSTPDEETLRAADEELGRLVVPDEG